MAALSKDAPVAVIGAGTMGAGIAQVAAQAGHPVLLFDTREEAAFEGRARLTDGLEKRAAKGKMTKAEVDAILTRIRIAESLDDLAPAKLAVEAVIEDAETKRQLFGDLEARLAEDAILASNTSTLSITALQRDLRRPGRCAGMHFFNPAQVMKLVEVIQGLNTAPEVAKVVAATAAAWGKKPVMVKSVPGFIVNRVARPFYSEAFRALQEGAADAATIDAVLMGCGGFRMGPFALTDLIGQDVNAAVTRTAFNAYSGAVRFLPALLQDELVAAGQLGQKSGHGIYDYRAGGAGATPRLHPAAPAPLKIAFATEAGPLADLAAALQAAGHSVATRADLPPAMMEVDGAFLTLTDGRLATERSAEAGRPVILLDHGRGAQKGQMVCLAAPDQADPEDLAKAAGLFQALGAEVAVIDDHPGMIVMRTVAMLANVAADAVRDGVAAPEDTDAAMLFGLNYPQGPLAWAEDIGRDWVFKTLENLAVTVGEDRYRPSQWLRRRVAAGVPLVG